MSCPSSAQPPGAHYDGAVAQVFMALLQTLVLKLQKMGDPQEYPKDCSCLLKDGKSFTNFDFIIVGGGTAGTILANRLSENPDWNVLLLEAGGIPSKSTEIPLFRSMLRGSKDDWAFEAEVEENACLGMHSGKCNMFLGKALGGTTSVAPEIYGRATRQDWEDWKAFNKTWGYDLVLSYYKRIENYKPDPGSTPCSCPIDLGENGSIPLRIFNDSHPVKDLILELAEEFSVGKMKDGKSFVGYLDVPFVGDGAKNNFAKIFLNPIATRKNLFVSMNSSVEKILITPKSDNKACGVLVNVNGNSVEIRARREVILSAGPINTPKILMMSGIGPKEHLEELNITVLNDLPVGQNLQSHYTVYLFIGFSGCKIDDELRYIDGLYDLIIHESGILTKLGITGLIGFIPTKKFSEPDNPTLAVEHVYLPKKDFVMIDAIFNNSIKYCHHIIYSLKKHNRKQDVLAFGLQILKPKSRGEVLLRNGTDATQPPIIKNNYFSEELDADQLVEGYKYITDLVNTDKMQKLKAKILKLNIPACRCFGFGTEDYMRCYVRNMGMPVSSVVGTTKLGIPCDPTSVVNDELLVHGFRCLRVVDSSVIPALPVSKTLGTIAMIAERMSDLIKEKWQKQ